MALIKCSNCGKEISDKALKCIHCNNPITKEDVEENSGIMFNAIVSFLVITLFMILGIIIAVLLIKKS